MREVYGEDLWPVRGAIDAAQAAGGEIQAMLARRFRQLNTDFGFSPQVPRRHPGGHVREITAMGGATLPAVHGPEMAHCAWHSGPRLLRALTQRLRTVFGPWLMGWAVEQLGQLPAGGRCVSAGTTARRIGP